MSCRYAPYYCEENIYQLARDRRDAGAREGSVVCISNASRTVALAAQRAGRGAARFVVWDYHVVYLEAGLVYDLDSILPVPTRRDDYLARTFPAALMNAAPELASVFSVVARDDYLDAFSSDRSHMRGPDGAWLRPPPPWPAIYRPELGNTLFALVDGAHPAVAYHGSNSHAFESPFQTRR